MKRLLLALLLLPGAAFRADAVDYTDIWYNAAQSGYGFNFIQSDQFIFSTFFVYGPGGAPTWLVAGLNYDGTSAWTGDLFAATGTYYGLPWNAANYVPTKVGTATFTPNPANNYQGTLTYTVNNAAAAAGADASKAATAVTVNVERQPLTAIPTGGSYAGGQPGSYSGCNTAANNGSYLDKFDLTVTHNANGAVTFDFSYESGLSCTLAGVYELHGTYYLVRDATYQCSDGVDTIAQMSEIKATSLGLEGRFTSNGVGDNCTEDAVFAGALL